MSTALVAVRGKFPTLGAHVDQLATLASLKQTHELTSEIFRFLDSAPSAGMSGAQMVDFFTEFVASFAARMSPLNLVKIIGRCVAPADVIPSSALSLLSKYESQISQSRDATIMAKVLSAEVHLRKSKDVAQARTIVDGVDELLKDPLYAHTVSGSARGSFHLVASEVYLALGNDLEFYRHLVKFLTYTPLAEIAPEVLQRTARQAAVIALVHAEINDFGELLSLPAFQGPSWTVDFLRAIHLGDFEAFDKAVKSHRGELAAEQNLLTKIDTSLRRKLTMIALAELAGTNRRLHFKDIAAHCRVAPAEVEELVMTTMGTGKLIRGVIDEVDSTVVVNWVKPRVLDNARIVALKNRIEQWADKAQQLSGQLVEMTPELLIA
jgi:26S proteasome regulatory subunit N9